MLTEYDSKQLLKIVNTIVMSEKYSVNCSMPDAAHHGVSLSEAWQSFYLWVEDQELQYENRNKGEW